MTTATAVRSAPAAPAIDARHAAHMARQVATVLENSPSFRGLSASEQDGMRRDLAKVTAFLSDPAAGLTGAARARAMAVPARALDDITKVQSQVKPVQNTGSEMDKGIRNWNADAAKAGGQAMKDQVDAVNFPKFVAGLISGVFNAIVDASIKQMKAYGDMLSAVAKTVDQFAQDHVTMPQAQQQVQSKFPSIFDMVEPGPDGMQIKMKDGVDQPDGLGAAFGVDGDVDASDPEGLQKIVIGAQMQLARQRQQQLAAMVMMGVNRIVVTDGKINAKVFIEVKSKDESTRNRTMNRGQSDTRTRDEQQHDGNIWGTDEDDTHETRVSSVNVNEAGSNNDTKKLETKAQLTGEVTVNFKSDYFPLERLTSAADLLSIQSTAAPGSAAPPAAAKA